MMFRIPEMTLLLVSIHEIHIQNHKMYLSVK
jgi:hypothetical protein